MKDYTPILGPIEKAAQDGLRNGMKEMLAVARKLAPVDDRVLVRSGAVRIDDLTGQVSFSARHARFQHENLDYEHAGGGQAKFLEAAADQVRVEDYIAAEIARALGG
ncbi:hypothetical protein [Microbacterium sp. Yaish 1]|uniref:hypothetical protein n=1 Tax=Microbacterium sp. Yaish 1 TaxID=2025014 RepID=UPI000B93B69E|nr:hypothetical protein [Microbacterium sp. Yaish 1]OYC97211.1 hypothetical protein CI089_01260 [Microbacterium sp. Yaish 1]